MDAVPVVWIAPDGAPRPAAADHALEAWGRAREIRLVAPEPSGDRALPLDPSIADAVEAELEKAHDATSARDAAGAERSLSRAEGLVRDHPELPQGAWLMAEVLRGWSTRWAKIDPKDPDRAATAWRRARGLDGGREPAVGEEAVAGADPAVAFTLTLDAPGDPRLDGAPVAAGPLRATAGEHQVAVSRHGRLVWAGWIGVAEGQTAHATPPELAPCSDDDLGRARLSDGSVHAEGVACARWVVAAPGQEAAAVLVALCQADQCAAPREWRAPVATPPGPAHKERSHWPAWATWTILGAGAVVLAGVAVGIDAAAHSGGGEPGFVGNGLHVTGPP